MGEQRRVGRDRPLAADNAHVDTDDHDDDNNLDFDFDDDRADDVHDGAHDNDDRAENDDDRATDNDDHVTDNDFDHDPDGGFVHPHDLGAGFDLVGRVISCAR
ncbi:MAG: hypothetical protein ACXVIH_13955 [Ilumatobacteraceae bacterium]